MMTRERLIKSNSATSDSQGRATFTLGPAEQGYVYEGSVQVPNAPAGALFEATVLTTNWGQWAGPTNYGPIQLYGGEFLTVTATGLNPSTAYVLTIFGVWGSENDFEPVPPGAPMSVVSVETSTKIIDGQVIAGAAPSFSFRVPSLTRRVTILVGATSGGGTLNVNQVTGDTSGVVYYSPATLAPFSGTFPKVHFFAVEPSVDATYTVLFNGGVVASRASIWVVSSTTNPYVTSTNGLEVIQVNPGLVLTAGSPVGTFSSAFHLAATAATANQVLVASPGAGNSIYLQSISFANLGAANTTLGRLHASGGGAIFCDVELAANDSKQVTFPGGFRLPSNTSLQMDTLATAADGMQVSGTYTTGPTA